MLTIAALLVALLPLAAISVATAPPAAAALPSGFTDTVAFSGLTQPTNIRFAPDGRIFVAEKGGQIKVFDGLGDTTPTVFADLRVETYDFWDRGLLGLTLSPNWPADPNAPGTRVVYAAYARDANIGGAAPKWGASTPAASEFDTCPTPPGATTDGCVISGRLVSFGASGTSDVAASGPTTLLDGWCQQFPSHTVGDLRVRPGRLPLHDRRRGRELQRGGLGAVQEPVRGPADRDGHQPDGARCRRRLAALRSPRTARPDSRSSSAARCSG